jgi:Tle cognate immunity protein 4 C-terminal domain/Tle cognate immunity protein 4 N-terminal domain
MTGSMKTRCVGRYLTDLPGEFVINSESMAKVEGVAVQVFPASLQAFEASLADREAELRSRHMDGEPHRPMLKRNEAMGRIVGAVFNRAEATGNAEFARTLELSGWRDGYRIEMSIKAIDGTDIPFDQSVVGTVYEASSRRVHDEYKSRNDVPEKLNHLLEVYERVSGRKDDEIPSTPGTCIAHGFVAGARGKDQDVEMIYHMKGVPDVYFTINAYDSIKEADTLLQRAAGAKKILADEGHKVVRQGVRSIHGSAYEELLMLGPTSDRVQGAKFRMHGNELRVQPTKPFLMFYFNNGYRIPMPEMDMNEKDRLGLFADLPKATLGDAESVALWDSVSATLRPRPGAFD